MMEGPLCYWGSDWWKGTGDSSSLAHGEGSTRPPALNTPGSVPALSQRLESCSRAGGTRRFMHALRRCHGSKGHRRCAAYLAEKLEPRSEEPTSELQSPIHLVCRLLLEKQTNERPLLRNHTPLRARSGPARARAAH